MACLFCRIVAGEVPAAMVHEDEALVAFLDSAPIRPGHVQIVPRLHVETFEALPDDLAAASIRLGQRLARAMKALYRVPRVGFAYTGGDVAHAHAHVVPMVAPTDITSLRYIEADGLRFRTPPRPPADEMAQTAAALRAALGG